jgi:hypothetical protein
MPKFKVAFDNVFYDCDDALVGFEVAIKDIVNPPTYEGVTIDSVSISGDEDDDKEDDVKLFVTVCCVFEGENEDSVEALATEITQKQDFTSFLKQAMDQALVHYALYDVEEIWDVLDVEAFSPDQDNGPQESLEDVKTKP